MYNQKSIFVKNKGGGDINSALLRKGTLKTKKIIQLCDINAQYTLFFTLEHEKNTVFYRLEICLCKVEKIVSVINLDLLK